MDYLKIFYFSLKEALKLENDVATTHTPNRQWTGIK